jgi:hypothetical protein
MRKISLLFILVLFIKNASVAQNVYFSLSNSVKFLNRNNVDTLKFPFVGGFQKPQFNKMDLNNDGVKDLIVFDAIGNKIITYLWKNNAWSHAPEFENSFPPLSQWLKLIDNNNDGKEDIFTATGPLYNIFPDQVFKNNSIRYLTNTSQGNKLSFSQKGNCLRYYRNEFEDCAEFTPTDIGVIDDINNDGKLDVLYLPNSSNSFNLFKNIKPMGSQDSIYLELAALGWGHFNYKVNTHGFNFQQPTFYLAKGGVHVSNSFAVYDLDADGDKDLIYGDGFFSNLIAVKNGKELSPLGKDSMISEDTIFPKNTYIPNDIIWPTPYFNDFDNDGVTDLIVTTHEPLGVKNTNNVYFYKNLAASNNVPVNFSFVKENFLQDEMIDLGGNSKPVFTDIDNDGDNDLIVATQGNYLSTKNSFDQLYLFKNIGNQNNPLYSLVDTNFANIQNNVTLPLTNVNVSFGDLNGDGKKDFVLGWYNGYIHYFENTSSGNSFSFVRKDTNYFNISAGTETAPQLIDLNKDGKLDLVIGKRNGTLAYFQNTGTATAPLFGSTPTIDSLGKINVRSREDTYGNAVPCIFDIDNDGIFEALVSSYSKGVTLHTGITANPNAIATRYANIFKDYESMTPDSINQGVYTSVSIANIDSDTLPEILIGNQRGGFRFYKTTVLGKISTTSTTEFNANQLVANVYPNPAKDYLMVELPSLNESFEVRIIDIIGNTLTMKNFDKNNIEAKIELNSLKSGIYFAKIKTQTNKVLIKRFVVSN